MNPKHLRRHDKYQPVFTYILTYNLMLLYDSIQQFYLSCHPGCFPVRDWNSVGAGGNREGVSELHEETHTQAGSTVGFCRTTTG